MASETTYWRCPVCKFVDDDPTRRSCRYCCGKGVKCEYEPVAVLSLAEAEALKRLREAVRLALPELQGLLLVHFDCEDPWYSCPLATESPKPREAYLGPERCLCGADEHNAKLNAVRAELLAAMKGGES